jgi:hypothetical protein
MIKDNDNDEEMTLPFADTSAQEEQLSFAGDGFGDCWQKHWEGMPEYEQEDQSPDSTVKVHFRNDRDRAAFATLIKQTITEYTKYVWYPEKKKRLDKVHYKSEL